MELIGTFSLPAAIILTFYLVIQTILFGAADMAPMILLLLTLFLPGVLILITARKPMYIVWMLVYMLFLPIWNFFLPLYAYWNFDDFTWGDTRKVEGEDKIDPSTRNGSYKIGSVQMKTLT